jgi:hypothetical protein
VIDSALLRAELVGLVRKELRIEGDLPAGDFSEVLDSMQLLALAVAIEDRYAICLDPEDEAGVRSFEDLVALVSRKLESAGGVDGVDA